MLKPFRIRDLLNPAAEEEFERAELPPHNGQSSPTSFTGPSLGDDSMMTYKTYVDHSTEGNTVWPYRTYDTQSTLSKNTIESIGDGSSQIAKDESGKSGLYNRHRTSGARSMNLAKGGDGIVRVSAEEYDETIAIHPQAKLSYLDEDDGDIITVGSSFELTQRLSEPASSTAAYVTSDSNSDKELQSPMHIFDINRSKSVLDIWRGFEKRTSLGFRPLDISIPSYPDPSVQESVTSDVAQPQSLSEKRDDDPRYRWFQLTNPPQVPLSTRKQSDNLPAFTGPPKSVSPFSKTGDILPCDNSIVPQQTSSSNSITEEGKRQAREAGSQLRRARSAMTETRKSTTSIPLTADNPWATFSTLPSSFKTHDSSQKESENCDSPVEENQPLLASFEAELSKLMEGKPVTESPDEETRGQNTPEANPPHPPPRSNPQPESEPSNQSIPRHSEMLAQTMQALLGGIGHLTSELRSKFPDVERRLSNAHHQIPSTVEQTIHNTISAIGGHVQCLANVMQDTATSSRASTERSREAEFLAADQVANGLRNLANDIGDMGRTLFSAFEAPSRDDRTTQEQSSGVPSPVNQNTRDNSTAEQFAPGPIVSVNSVNSESVPEDSGSVAVCPSEISQESEKQTVTREERQSSGYDQNTVLFIGNLSIDATEKDVQEAFASKGFLGKVYLPKDAATGRHPGFCYIDFPCHFAASGALQALTSDTIHHQAINLEFSHSPIVDSTDDSTQEQHISPTRPSPFSGLEMSESQQTSRPLLHATKPQRASFYRYLPLPGPGDASSSNTTSTGIRRAKSLGSLSRSLVNGSPRSRVHAMSDIKERPEDQEKPDDEDNDSLYDSSIKAEKRRPLSLSSAATAGNTMGRDDVEPGFSSRYPSLVPDAYGHDRWPQPFATGDQGLHPFPSPTLQTERFPTVSQVEAHTAAAQQSHGGGLLRPRKSPSPLHEAPAPENSAYMPSQLGGTELPGSWPPETDPFHPYVPGGLHRSNTTIVSDSAARLAGPFVPHTERHERHEHSGLRRSATECQHRRPQGGSFGRHRRTFRERLAPYNTHMRSGPSTETLSNIPGGFPVELPPVPPKPTHKLPENQPGMREQHPANEHQPPRDNLAQYHIDRCVSHLELLGYGYSSSQPVHNLRVYAEASNGNLEEAIEMIEEERKAYEQQYPRW
ncbi:hypothetical protein AJ79_04327 [Helicocarpus griseus UAMH5409]|uniref:RRM domain-containing protein n=1 Tax=Helicocarpus griseus UAMH5409 TaxID=1447875 RepID=A0A2B7XTU1_9EURO|nr:hypothetical protein AJ79_04327 [Helicocarpus griseus UAMH5409]